MDVILNIIQGLVGLAMLAAGGMKATQAKEVLEPNMAWVEDFTGNQVRLIGIAELLAGIALALSLFITSPIALLLGGIAAVCLAVLMGGAIYTHVRRGDSMAETIPSVIMTVLSLIIAWSLLI